MKKFGALKLTLIGILGFAIGAVFFFPWNAVCDYVMAKGLSVAAENGIYGTVQDNYTEGFLDREFVYRGVQADFPVFRLTSREIHVNPAVFSTIFKAAPTASLTFGRGEITPVTRQKLEWNSGAANVSVKSGIMSVRDIEFTGKFSARGFVEFSAETGKISRANLTLKVPEDMDRAIQMLGTTGMLPVSKIRSGEWKVEK